MREPEAQDLSPLDPRSDTERWNRMVGSIMSRCAFELQRRQQTRSIGVFDSLMAWWSRPALATAAALAALSLIALSQFESRSSFSQSAAYIRSPNMPDAMTVLLEQGEIPSMLDMLVLTGEEN